MRKAGRLAAEVLDMIVPHVQPGVSTLRLDEICHEFIVSHGAVPAPLGYRGYPKSICTSVNHVVCHGIPGEYKLKDGDIINIDVTVIVDGWHGDTSRMYWAGEPKILPRRLTQVTYDAMMKGIEEIRPGATLGDIGHAVQSYAESFRFSVVREYCGHGIGKVFHAPPSVLHYGRRGKGTVLKPGMFLTVEPMINTGDWRTILSKHDGWTVTTRDKSLSAQFEHSIGVTDDGYEIFTQSPKGLHHPPYA
ncbi:MAG: type I methionyl aminopeptidase [Alphaproteobacteria bacterium]|nr:type I methionyl aminopeptidase [Alphaproteobacteria bacterium]